MRGTSSKMRGKSANCVTMREWVANPFVRLIMMSKNNPKSVNQMCGSWVSWQVWYWYFIGWPISLLCIQLLDKEHSIIKGYQRIRTRGSSYKTLIFILTFLLRYKKLFVVLCLLERKGSTCSNLCRLLSFIACGNDAPFPTITQNLSLFCRLTLFLGQGCCLLPDSHFFFPILFFILSLSA